MIPLSPVGVRPAPPCIACFKSCQQHRDISVSVLTAIFQFSKVDHGAKSIGAVSPPQDTAADSARRGHVVAVESLVPHGVYRVLAGTMTGRGTGGRRSDGGGVYGGGSSIAGGSHRCMGWGLAGRWMLSKGKPVPTCGGVRSISGRPALRVLISDTLCGIVM